jgi:DNA repair exonuclease SbcCD ATPase subunit
MSQIILNFFGDEVFIDTPKNLLILRTIISSIFRLNLEDAQELTLTYKDNNSKISQIETEEDYKTFLSQRIRKISTEISPNSKLYKCEVEKRNEEEEIDKDKKQLQELIELDKEMEKPIPDRFKAENEEIEEINEKISELNKRKNELIKKIHSAVEEKNKKHQEVKKKIAELQEKLGLPPKCHLDRRVSPGKVSEKKRPISQLKNNYIQDKVEKDKLDEENNKKSTNETHIKSKDKHSFSRDEKKYKSKEKEEEKKYYHIGYVCDGCDQPIFGIRYKCAVCKDFDFCEICEAKFAIQHGHPLLKIKNPKEAPIQIKCLFGKNIK